MIIILKVVPIENDDLYVYAFLFNIFAKSKKKKLILGIIIIINLLFPFFAYINLPISSLG